MTTTEFRSLHDDWLILPCAWDALSARVLQHRGFAAIATTSAGIAWSLGLCDGALSRVELVSVVRRIVGATECMVSVDLEAGYSTDASEVASLVVELADFGVVGVNIEDHGADGQRERDEFATWLAQIIDRVSSECDLFVNARIDTWLNGATGSQATTDVIERARAYSDAGAEGVFIPGIPTADIAAAVVNAVNVAVNVMGDIDGDHRSWQQAGVRRLSSGMNLAQTAYATLGGPGVERSVDTSTTLDFATVQGWFT